MRHHSERLRRGFTLIELLVVLAILAALSLIALRSSTGLEERTRLESTARALDNAESAILENENGSPGQVEGGGFLADVGRLPDFSNIDAQKRLIELWRAPTGMALNHLASDADDPDVRLSCGWRGPYLRLPTGRDPATTEVLEDGFGYPLVVRLDVASSRWQLISTGSDGLLDVGTESAADVVRSLPAGIERAELSGGVNLTSTAGASVSWEVLVFAFEPDPTSGNLRVLQEDNHTPHAGTGPGQFSFSYSFTGANALTPGPRRVRAYRFTAPNPPRASPHKSRLNGVLLLHGAQTLELTIDT